MFVFSLSSWTVLGRDLAEIAAESMAANVGFYTANGSIPNRALDPNVCAICGNQLLVKVGEEAILEKTIRLSCNHEWDDRAPLFPLRPIISNRDVECGFLQSSSTSTSHWELLPFPFILMHTYSVMTISRWFFWDQFTINRYVICNQSLHYTLFI